MGLSGDLVASLFYAPATEKARSLLEESLAISTDLGMRPLMERVLSLRDILKA